MGLLKGRLYPFLATLLLAAGLFASFSFFFDVHVMGPKEAIQVCLGTCSVANRPSPGAGVRSRVPGLGNQAAALVLPRLGFRLFMQGNRWHVSAQHGTWALMLVSCAVEAVCPGAPVHTYQYRHTDIHINICTRMDVWMHTS